MIEFATRSPLLCSLAIGARVLWVIEPIVWGSYSCLRDATTTWCRLPSLSISRSTLTLIAKACIGRSCFCRLRFRCRLGRLQAARRCTGMWNCSLNRSLSCIRNGITWRRTLRPLPSRCCPCRTAHAWLPYATIPRPCIRPSISGRREPILYSRIFRLLAPRGLAARVI